MTLDYGCPQELLKDPSAKPRRKEAMNCSERVRDSGRWPSYHPCPKPVKVERNGKPYCTIHDPEREKRIREEKEAEIQAHNAPFKEAVAALGCGWHQSYKKADRISLTLADAQALVKRLQEKP